MWLKPSLSSIANSISEINKRECKACMERKNIKSECDFMEIKDNQLSYKRKKCNKKWLKPVNELIKKFSSIYQFCNGDLNKFVLLLRKGVYPYEDMNNWEKFNETTLPPKEAFYSKLNEEDITDKGYAHAQKVWEVFEIKNLVNIMIFMFNVIHYCLQMCLKALETNVLKFMSLILLILSAPELAWQECLNKTEINLELLTNIDMLLMVEEGIRGGMCQAVYRYAKANNKYMKNYDKDIESSYLEYLDANNLYGWAMSQKLPVDGFKWVKDLSKFNESFIKNYDENSDKGYILEVDVEYPKKLFNLHKDLPFLPKIEKRIV